MKASQLLPSAAVLAVGGTWLVLQERTISSVETETAVLIRQVEAAKSAAASSATAAATAVKQEEETFDWNELLAKPPYLDPREGQAFGQRVRAMTLEQIIAKLDEIAALDLPEESRNKLTSMFVGGLTTKDPKATLDRFYKKPGRGFGFGPADQHLKYALAAWAGKDPAAAAAWLDSKVANGDLVSTSLEGIHSVRVEFEREMIRSLTVSDSAAAEKRLVTMTEGEAARVLERLLSEKDQRKADPLALAKMARDTLPEKRAQEVISGEASSRAYEGRDEVLAYLATVQATPGERHLAIDNAAQALVYQLGKSGAVTSEGIAELRGWVQANQSGSTGHILGNAIAQAMVSDTLDSEQASALLLAEFGKAPDDDLIIGFLSDKDRYPAGMGRDLAARISDPVKRAEMLEKLR